MKSFKNCGEYIATLDFAGQSEGWGIWICFDDLVRSISDYGLKFIGEGKYEDVGGNVIEIINQSDYSVEYRIFSNKKK